jgi:hypothetical protein
MSNREEMHRDGEGRGGERWGGETETVGRGRACNTNIVAVTDSNTE